MSTLAERIASYYDQGPEREWERMERHRTEFAVTLRAMETYMPSPPARVLDCGGGPGRYAIELARRGHQVTLFDLSGENLRLAREKAQTAGVELAATQQGNATDLSRFQDEAFDAIILMGPLYHLLDAGERRRALLEARRALKPGGVLFGAFVSRYAVHRYLAKEEPDTLGEDEAYFARLADTGRMRPRGESKPEFIAYLAHPKEIEPSLWEMGLEVRALLGVEGLVSRIEEGVNTLDGEIWERWVDVNYLAAGDPSIHGCVEHLLAVAVKPKWRSVLRRIVAQLEETGLGYKVVGGGSIALHGVPVTVKDLDMEMSVENVYRFEKLFSDQARQPAGWREDRIYRSHIGRYDFDGVQVEVFGDLQRRDGNGWTPTTTQTEATVELDGVGVSVSQLEEETLAYIRRGRLQRAALCLASCDHQRLLELIRQGERLNVL